MNAVKYLACLGSNQWKTSRLSPVFHSIPWTGYTTFIQQQLPGMAPVSFGFIPVMSRYLNDVVAYSNEYSGLIKFGMTQAIINLSLAQTADPNTSMTLPQAVQQVFSQAPYSKAVDALNALFSGPRYANVQQEIYNFLGGHSDRSQNFHGIQRMNMLSREMSPLSANSFVSRRRILTAALASLMLCSNSSGQVQSYSEPIGLGMHTFRDHDTCGMFTAYFSAAGFLDGLQRTVKNGDIVFTKGKKQVTHFPALVNLRLEAVVGGCTSEQSKSSWSDDRRRKYFNALRFESSWCTSNTQVRSVSPTVQVIEPHPIAWSERDPSTGEIPRTGWEFSLMLPSSDIPLNNTLVIHIFSADSVLLTSLKETL